MCVCVCACVWDIRVCVSVSVGVGAEGGGVGGGGTLVCIFTCWPIFFSKLANLNFFIEAVVVKCLFTKTFSL